jgi:DNA-binding transcriptional regulator YdaS (Cro superfamily)
MIKCALDGQVLIEKIRQLSPQRLADVEDFGNVLRAREDEQRLTQAAAKAGEASFAAVWNNDEDAAYGQM